MLEGKSNKRRSSLVSLIIPSNYNNIHLTWTWPSDSMLRQYNVLGNTNITCNNDFALELSALEVAATRSLVRLGRKRRWKDTSDVFVALPSVIGMCLLELAASC